MGADCGIGWIGASLNCWSIHHRGPGRGCVEDQPQQLALNKKSDYEVGLGALRLVLRTQSRSNNLGMLGLAWGAARGKECVRGHTS